MTKKLKIYKENDDYIVERINEFNYRFKESLDNDIQVLDRLQDYAENGKDYTVMIKLDDKYSQQMLEQFCDRTINLKTTTWKGKKINQELER